MRTKYTLVAALLAASFAQVAAAQIAPPAPTCAAQKNTTAADAAKRDGLKYYRKSKAGNEPAGGPDMTAALSFFEAACANGDDTALELRAYALASLERHVDAAVSLDAFIAAHPLETLPPDVKSRVAAAQEDLDKHVATLRVESMPSALSVAINHRAIGKTPLTELRLLPGTFDVTVTPEQGSAVSRTLDLPAGRHTESFDFTVKVPDPSPVEAPVKPVAEAPAHSLRPFFITAVVLGVLTLGGGVGMLAWSQSRSGAYNDRCGVRSPPSDCPDILSQYSLGLNLGIAGFIGAGVFTGAAIALFVLEPKPATQNVGMSCGVMGMGGRCALSF